MPSKLITIGTDVAAFVLFHPDDLAHRDDHPIGWYSYDFAHGPDAAEGRMIAFFTGSDGGYAVRLTTDGLTPREQQWAVASFPFRYRARHGRVLLDNTDALPGEGHMSTPQSDDDVWFELANGDYRVTVHAIAWHEELGAVDKSGRGSASALPDYVVEFDRVDSLSAVPTSSTPPDLRAVRGWIPKPYPPGWAEDAYRQPSGELREARLAVLPSDCTLSLGFSASIPAPDRFLGVDMGESDGWLPGLSADVNALAVAPAAGEGSLALMADINGSSQVNDELLRLNLVGRRLVTLGEVEEGEGGWLWATVRPLARPASVVPAGELDALKAKIEELAETSESFRARLKFPGFELLRMRAIASPEALTGWLVPYLDLPQHRRLQFLALSDADRLAALPALLTC